MKKVKILLSITFLAAILFSVKVFANDDDLHQLSVLKKSEPIVLNEKIESKPKTNLLSDISEAEMFFRMEDLLKDAVLKGKNRVDISQMNININDYPNLGDIYFFSPYFSNGINCSLAYYIDGQCAYWQINNSMSIEETKQYFSKVDKKIIEIKKTVSSYMSDLKKALTIHDYLCCQFEYDNDSFESGLIPEDSFRSGGLFINEKGVCQAYAYGYKYIMNLFGIECYVVSSDQMAHAWNIINIDGSYYHVDCTWDDPVYDKFGAVQHEYFLISDETLKKDKEHYGWSSDLICDSQLYEEEFWNTAVSPVIFIDNKVFYVTEDGYLNEKNLITDNVKTIVYFEPWQSGTNGYWMGCYSGLFYHEGYLYYNTSSIIKRINVDSYVSEDVYKPNLTNGDIYGIRNKNGIIQYSIQNSPNDLSHVINSPIKLESSNIEVEVVILDKESQMLSVGESDKLIATINPENATDQTLTWSSSDEKVATVDQNGNVKAINEGIAVITVTTSNGKTAICTITVKQPKQGWVDENGSWYYYKNGKKVTGWININNIWYYMNKDGIMQINWQFINGYWYYFGTNGAMRTDWQFINGTWYCFSGSGAMKTGWQSISGVWYYFGTDGAMRTDWQCINGTWYCFSGSGAMKTGWQSIGGVWYYFGTDGSMRTDWQCINGTWYCFSGSGAMKTGWQKINGLWYYFGTDGAMRTGSHKINGVTYTFNSNGVWVS